MTEKKRGRPRITDQEKELRKLTDQFDKYEKDVKDLTQDELNKAPLEEKEPQVKMSQREMKKSTDVYLKPERSINNRDKFNEKFREQWNFSKQYVHFKAENREILNEVIELWTRPFGGIPAEFWKVPVNKPVWGPRHLADQIRSRKYHILMMEEKSPTSEGFEGQYYGKIVVKKTVNRLYAEPVEEKTNVFMGETAFK